MTGRKENVPQDAPEQLTLLKGPFNYISSLVKGERGMLTIDKETFTISKFNESGESSSVSTYFLVVDITINGEKHKEHYVLDKSCMVEMSFEHPPLVDIPASIHDFRRRYPTVKLPFEDDHKTRLWARAFVVADYIRKKVERK